MRNSTKISNGVKRICPSEIELSKYLDSKPSETERLALESHIANCRSCLDLLVIAHQAERKKAKKKEILHLIKKVKGGLGIKIVKGSAAKWLILSIIFFILSFIFSRYFLQFLIGATILALKWVFEGEGAKRVVMIFKGMKDKDSELHRNHVQQLKNFEPR